MKAKDSDTMKGPENLDESDVKVTDESGTDMLQTLRIDSTL